jgi:hypothetical protein
MNDDDATINAKAAPGNGLFKEFIRKGRDALCPAAIAAGSKEMDKFWEKMTPDANAISCESGLRRSR